MKRLLVLIALLGVFFLVVPAEFVLAAPGVLQQINFQGKVVNGTTGTNVADGTYSFTFNIYSVSSGGSAIWTETKNVTVTNGIFQTNLGDTTSLPGSVDFNTDNIYLGINFNSDGEMSPRVRFTAAPYALNAGRVAGLTVTNTTGTLTIANGETISFGGSFSTSGTNDVAFTTSGTTALTLPTTGTLATLAGTETLTNKTIGNTGLTFENNESIGNSTNGTFTFSRNDAGTVSLTAADNDSTAALAITSGGAATLSLDAGGAAGLNLGTTNANAITLGNAGSTTSITFDKGSSGNFIFRSNGAALDCSGFDSSGKLTLNASGQLICANDVSGAVEWNLIGDASGDDTVNLADTSQGFDWDLNTNVDRSGFTFNFLNDIAGDSSNQYALRLRNQNDGGSNGTTEGLLVIDNNDTNESVAAGILFVNAGGGFTTGIDMANLTITNIGAAGTDFSATGGLTLADSLAVSSGGLTVTTGGATISAGDLAVNSDTITSDGTLTINANSSVVLGGSGNTFTFSETTGPAYAGTARPTRQVTLSPEYPGATLTADGGTNTGTMTTDFCEQGASTDIPNTNTGVCNTAGDIHNYYSWTTNQGSAQDYDIWIRWRVPDNFSAWAASNPMLVYGKRTDATNNAVTVYVYDTAGTLENTGGTQVAGTNWTQTSVEASFAGTYTAGSYMTIRVVMTADTGGDSVQAGEINLNYLSAN